MAAKPPKHVLVAEHQRRNRRKGLLEELEAVFGAAPVLNGEDEIAFLDLASRVRGTFQPRDVIEEIYARDVADLQWEANRLKRAIATIQSEAMRRAALRLIRSVDPNLARDLEARGQSDDKIFSALTGLGISRDRAHAAGLVDCLEEIERIRALLSKTEIRRDTIIREFERRRELRYAPKVIMSANDAGPLKALPKNASQS